MEVLLMSKAMKSAIILGLIIGVVFAFFIAIQSGNIKNFFQWTVISVPFLILILWISSRIKKIFSAN